MELTSVDVLLDTEDWWMYFVIDNEPNSEICFGGPPKMVYKQRTTEANLQKD